VRAAVERRGIRVPRARHVAARLEHQAKRQQRLRMSRTQADRLAELRLRVVEPAALVEEAREVAPRRREVGTDRERPLVVRDGLVAAAALGEEPRQMYCATA
jgi:hypothetical protein